jgi:hypothetical protein
MAGKARQWQHAGNNVGKRDAVGLLRGGLPAAVAFVRDVLVHRMLRDGCLSVSPSFLACFLSSHAEGCARPNMNVAVLVCTPH